MSWALRPSDLAVPSSVVSPPDVWVYGSALRGLAGAADLDVWVRDGEVACQLGGLLAASPVCDPGDVIVVVSDPGRVPAPAGGVLAMLAGLGFRYGRRVDALFGECAGRVVAGVFGLGPCAWSLSWRLAVDRDGRDWFRGAVPLGRWERMVGR